MRWSVSFRSAKELRLRSNHHAWRLQPRWSWRRRHSVAGYGPCGPDRLLQADVIDLSIITKVNMDNRPGVVNTGTGQNCKVCYIGKLIYLQYCWLEPAYILEQPISDIALPLPAAGGAVRLIHTLQKLYQPEYGVIMRYEKELRGRKIERKGNKNVRPYCRCCRC